MNPYWQTGWHCTLLRMGIVPPARNFAVSPETAVTVGSASVWATPCRSNARSVALSSPLPLNQLSVASDVATAPLIAKGLSRVRLPFGPVPLKLTPSCLTISRRMSATVTCRLTWSAPRIVRELISLPHAELELPLAPLDAPPEEPEPPLAPPDTETTDPDVPSQEAGT